MREKQPAIYFHTHWDREWYEPFRSYQVRLAEVVDAILDGVESDVLPCFALDGQTVLLDDYLALRPRNRERLHRLVENGKFSVGPWFVMPDEFLVGGESLLRNLKRGITEARAWGCHQWTGYLPDTFGHSADMPTLLQQVGIGHAMVWRGVSPQYHEFTWESPSGDQILGYHLGDGYFQMMLQCEEDDPDLGEGGKTGALKRLSEKLRQAALSDQYLLPIGGDHLGPPNQAAVALLKKTLPTLSVTTPERFLIGLAKDSIDKTGQLQHFKGELTDNNGAFLLPGVYSARMYLKQANRQLEHLLVRRWEPLTVLSRLLIQSPHLQALDPQELYLQELDIAWRLLMLNHPHDSICGCSVDAVHRENEVRFTEIAELAKAVIQRQQAHLLEKLAGPNQWLVINPGSCPYTGVLPVYVDNPAIKLTQSDTTQTVLADGYRVSHQQVPLAHKTVQRQFGWIWVEDVPPLGYRVVEQTKATTEAFHPVSVQPAPRQKTAARHTKSKATSTSMSTTPTLDNEFYTVSVQADGTLTVLEKATGQTFSGLHAWRDTLQQGDSYNAAPVPGVTTATAQLQQVKVLHNGPLMGELALAWQLEKPRLRLTTKVRLEAGNPLVIFETSFTNTAPDHQLQVGFPTGQPIHNVLAESHFSVIERSYDPDFCLEAHMPVAPWKELKPNTGPIQRFLSTNGHAWITEGMAEYEVAKDTLYLTLFRGFGMLSKADTGVRGAQAGPPLPTPEGQCLNRSLTLRYAWCPKKPSATLFELSNRFYGTALALSSMTTSHLVAQAHPSVSTKALSPSHSLLQWDNPCLVLSACFLNADQQLIVRLLNLSEQPQQTILNIGFPYQDCQVVNALDEAIDETIIAEAILEELISKSPSHKKEHSIKNGAVKNSAMAIAFKPFALKSWMFRLS